MLSSLKFRFVHRPVIVTFLLLAAWGAAPAATAGSNASSSGTWPRLQVHSTTLDNGLEVLVLERPGSPTVACYLHFRVGTADEGPATLGLSHMLEHLLFKGSRHLNTRDYRKEADIMEEIDRVGVALDRARGEGAEEEKIRALQAELEELKKSQHQLLIKDEFESLLLRAGADTVNGTTWADATNYFSTLPANQLELWLAAMADQMGHAVLREFYQERDVVMEERRLRLEDDPQGVLIEALTSTAFIAHPYRNSDWMSVLKRLTREDAQRHYETYYGANNAVLALVGDVRFEEVLPLIKKYMGRLPKRPAPPEIHIEEPVQRGERRVQVYFDAEPALAIAYHVPGLTHEDEPALALLSALLGGHGTAGLFESAALEYPEATRWSRLYRRLIEKQGLAQEILMGGHPGDRYARLLVLLVQPRAPHDLADLERGVLDQLDELKRRRVSPEELDRARRNLIALYLRILERNMGAAWMIGYTQGVSNDWRTLERYIDALGTVEPTDVQRVARTYLREHNRTVVWRSAAPDRDEDELLGGGETAALQGKGSR